MMSTSHEPYAHGAVRVKRRHISRRWAVYVGRELDGEYSERVAAERRATQLRNEATFQ